MLTLLAYTLFQVSRSDQFQFFGELIYEVDTIEKIIALTFDDGPTEMGTGPVLEILRIHNVKGTFYLNGWSLKEHPELTSSIIDAGHEIGNHSYSHKRMVFMSYSEVAHEIESTTKLIQGLGYEGVIRFRPPFGKKLFVLPYYLSKNNITTVTWNIETESFNKGEDTPELIVKRAMDSVKPGSIMLMHVMYGDGSSLKALPEIITKLKKQGYAFATVSELIALSEKSPSKR